MPSIASAKIYINKLIDLPIEEFLGKYFPKRTFRCLTSERPENIVASFVRDEIVDFYISMECRLTNKDQWDIFNESRDILIKNKVIVATIIKRDKQNLTKFMKEFSDTVTSFTEVDSSKFLKNKGIEPTRAVKSHFYYNTREYRLKKKK